MRMIEKTADGAVFCIITLAATVMVTSTFMQVFCRYILRSPLYWSEELGRYCFVWMVFTGGAWAGKNLSHLGVDCLVSKLPIRISRTLEAAADLLVVLFSGVVTAVSIPVVRVNMRQLSPALEIPMGLVYLAIPAGFTLIFIYYLCHLVRHTALLTGSRPPEAEERTEGGTC